jgi:hypothetical protein
MRLPINFPKIQWADHIVGPTLSGTSQFVGPGFGSTLVLAGILISRKIIKYVVHTY